MARHGFSPAVAEMALGLILTCLASNLRLPRPDACRQGAVGQQLPDDIDPLERELTGRSVGIIGLGQVGGRLAELLPALPCCSSRPTIPFLPDEHRGKAGGAQKVELKELIKSCDVVVALRSIQRRHEEPHRRER